MEPISRTLTRNKSTIDVFSDGRSAVTLENGSKFHGEWKDGKPHGFGEMEDAHGMKYKGEFNMGKFHGKGLLITKAGEYDGSFKENKMNGDGIFTYADGTKYKGPFSEGVRSGKGEITRRDGSSYVGQFKADLQHGQGVAIGADGSRYEGEWRSGKKHGPGIIKYKNGMVYDGSWSDDRFGGFGELKGPNILVKGDFKDGVLNGKGVMNVMDGRKYEGLLEQGKPHGMGRLTLPDGSVYEGEFQADNRHGQGRFDCKRSGIVPFVYDGQWQEDRRHGKGTLTFEGNQVFNGSFDHGRPVAGEFSWADGTKLPFEVEDRYAAFLGHGSPAIVWEMALLRIMNAKKDGKVQAVAAAADADESQFGFDVPAAAGPASPPAAAPTAGEGDEWEEVELDENGVPIEGTARPVPS